MSVLDPLSHVLAVVIATTHTGVTSLGVDPTSATAWVLCIAVVVAVVRIVLLPLAVQGVRLAHASARARPQLLELTERYRGRKDPVSLRALAAERRRIAAEHNIPRLGFLPLLMQLPMWMALYHLVAQAAAGIPVGAMDAGLDTGPIVAAASWPLTGGETAAELEAKAGSEAAALLGASLGDWVAGRLQPRPQDDAAASLTRPLRRDDGRLDGETPANLLERRVRAYAPWPGTFLETEAGRFAVHRAETAPSEPGDRPGVLVEDGNGIALATVDGRLRLLEVQPAGGRRMSSEAWRRGRPNLVGTPVIQSRLGEP